MRDQDGMHGQNKDTSVQALVPVIRRPSQRLPMARDRERINVPSPILHTDSAAPSPSSYREDVAPYSSALPILRSETPIICGNADKINTALSNAVDSREDSSTPIPHEGRANGMAIDDREEMARIGEHDDDRHGGRHRKGFLSLFCCRT
jgi:casein kinase 1